LAEGVEFEDVNQYQDAINTLKEGYFPKAPRTNNAEVEADQALLNEEGSEETTKPRVSREMAAYANALERTIRK
jgi:GH25 family lysozyme M1 (1,4-beta-N-acetylmuramidase)